MNPLKGFFCQCKQGFSGTACQKNLLPCSLPNMCINNSTCTNIKVNETSYRFNCTCPKNYFGLHCENKVKVCANKTCLNMGWCVDENDKAVCKCYKLFSGDHCEIETSELKFIKQRNKIFAIIAIIILVVTFSLFPLNDIANIFIFKTETKPEPKKKKRPKVKVVIEKLVYTP